MWLHASVFLMPCKAVSTAFFLPLEPGGTNSSFRLMTTNEYDFFDTISPMAYAKRGFIKEGELLTFDPGEVFGIRCAGPSRHVDIFDISKSEANIYIAEITDESNYSLSVDDTERHLLTVLNETAEFDDKSTVVFLLFSHFSEPATESYAPTHRNECFEFRGRYEFVKAAHGWVLLHFDRVVHIKPLRDFWDRFENDE